MYIRIFAAPFLLIMFLSSQIMLLPSQVFARFCGCGNCWMQYVYPGYCSCGGIYPTCLTDDSNSFQFHASTDNSPVDIRAIPERPTYSVAKPDVMEGVVSLMSGGKCLHNRVTLNLLGDARGDLKFIPVRFDERNL